MLDYKLSNKSAKFLSKYDDELYERFKEKINKLRDNPFPTDCKRVVNRKDKTFRVRVGDYRILYVVIKEKNLLFISDIDKRPKVF